MNNALWRIESSDPMASALGIIPPILLNAFSLHDPRSLGHSDEKCKSIRSAVKATESELSELLARRARLTFLRWCERAASSLGLSGGTLSEYSLTRYYGSINKKL